MACNSCLTFTSGTKIKLPADLTQVIAKVAEAINNDVLKYQGAGRYGEPFAYLVRGGHWGDFVSNYFSCKLCGQLFHLHAETYHGSGGAFEKIKEISEQLQSDVYP